LRQAEEDKAAEVENLQAKVRNLTGPATQKAKAGKEQDLKAAADELEAKRTELAKLTTSREEAEKAFMAEIDRLGKT
jgi:hypothetical protein